MNLKERTRLSGRYALVDEGFLREKAKRHDPRRVFYQTMLGNDTYEAYLAQVGTLEVVIEGYKANPITGRDEILYCRRRGWIEDAD